MKWPMTVPFDCPWCDYHTDLRGQVRFTNRKQSGTVDRLTSLTFRLETTHHVCPGSVEAREAPRADRRAYQRAYYASHRGERTAKRRAYDAAHRGARVAYQRAYYERHRGALVRARKATS